MRKILSRTLEGLQAKILQLLKFFRIIVEIGTHGDLLDIG